VRYVPLGSFVVSAQRHFAFAISRRVVRGFDCSPTHLHEQESKRHSAAVTEHEPQRAALVPQQQPASQRVVGRGVRGARS